MYYISTIFQLLAGDQNNISTENNNSRISLENHY